jgi:hypothetical protein
MLRHALVGAGIVFAANMAAQTDYVKAKVASDPNGLIWSHANVLVGALGLIAAHKFGLIG